MSEVTNTKNVVTVDLNTILNNKAEIARLESVVSAKDNLNASLLHRINILEDNQRVIVMERTEGWCGNSDKIVDSRNLDDVKSQIQKQVEDAIGTELVTLRATTKHAADSIKAAENEMELRLMTAEKNHEAYVDSIEKNNQITIQNYKDKLLDKSREIAKTDKVHEEELTELKEKYEKQIADQKTTIKDLTKQLKEAMSLSGLGGWLKKIFYGKSDKFANREIVKTRYDETYCDSKRGYVDCEVVYFER